MDTDIRYLVFAWDNYYPHGGFLDLQFKAVSTEQIVENVRKKDRGNSDNSFVILQSAESEYWREFDGIQVIQVSNWSDITSEIETQLSTHEEEW